MLSHPRERRGEGRAMHATMRLIQRRDDEGTCHANLGSLRALCLHGSDLNPSKQSQRNWSLLGERGSRCRGATPER